MPQLYPLRFQPILRRYLWGGRKLATLLGKQLPAGNDYAESWEVADHGQDQTVVAAGPLAGVTLGQLVRDQGAALFGRHHPQQRFPLLLKFLDAQQRLSLQVHPDDAAARRLDPPDLGKSEAWVVLDAEPGSFIYAGLKRGFDRAALERELARGTCELCIHRLEPRVGDCIFLPAGVVHAIGSGLVIAEIQQSSDVTYRLFDWNRPGPDGRPRQLHIDRALAAIDFSYGPVSPQRPQPGPRASIERLVACDKFVLDRWNFDAPEAVGGDERFHILAVLEGSVAIAGDPAQRPITKGDVALVPASMGAVQLTPQGTTVLLDAFLP